MKEIEFYEIDGMNFTTQEFDYDVGAPLFWRLLKMCGKSLMSFLFEGIAGLFKELSNGEISKEEMASMDVMEIFGKLDKTKVVDAVEYFLQNIEPDEMVRADGSGVQQKILQTTWLVNEDKTRRSINWKTDFKGKYGTSFKLLKKVLLLQFQSVFQNASSGTADQNKAATQVVGKMIVAR